MDRRTLLAEFLCLAVYYSWFVLRGPPPEIAAVDTDPGAQQVPEPVVPAAPEPEPIVVADHPVRDVPFAACGIEGNWSTDGGGLRSVRLMEHQQPYQIQALYNWLIGKITGSLMVLHSFIVEY